MRNSVLVCTLSNFNLLQKDVFPYSKVLAASFLIWISLYIISPSPITDIFISPAIDHFLFVIASYLTLFILLASLWCTYDCSRTIPFVQISYLTVYRALYGLVALLVGSSTFLFGNPINAIYILIVLSLAFVDSRPKKARFYCLMSLSFCIFNLLFHGNILSIVHWINAFQQYSLMWLFATLSYVMFRAMNTR